MGKYHYLLLTVIFLCAGLIAGAQSREPVVRAGFIPDSIAIGDHFRLEVTVDKDMMQAVEFPVFNDGSLGRIIEIMSEEELDTVTTEGRRVMLRKVYNLTTFEDGLLSLGRYPLLYVDKNIVDTIWSVDSLLLKVGTFEIDTVANTIYDIKLPLSAPLKFGEFAIWLLIVLLVLILLGLGTWLYIIRRRRLTFFGRPVPVELPHVAAIKALETLHNQKLWQNNKHKLYYTRLTDILRNYLEGRYGIPAPEMTTVEIIEGLNKIDIDKQGLREIDNVLEISDLVKFAKYIPDTGFNEEAYNSVYYFVENTKPISEEQQEVKNYEQDI